MDIEVWFNDSFSELLHSSYHQELSIYQKHFSKVSENIKLKVYESLEELEITMIQACNFFICKLVLQ